MIMSIDTHEELFVLPWNHGVKLLTHQQKEKQLSINKDELQSVGQLLQLPINVYFLNHESEIQNINKNTLINCSFPSKKSTIGKTISITAKKQAAKKIIQNDLKVMRSGKMHIFDEYFIQEKDNNSFHTVSFKFPWYSGQEKIIGILGCSIIIGENQKYSLANSLDILVKTRLLSRSFEKNIFNNQIDGINLTKQEHQCLRLLIKGGTNKTIAKILKISPRTVESYLQNVKIKLNVHSKSELISKVFDSSDFF